MNKNVQIITVALVTAALITILITMKESSSTVDAKKGTACNPGIAASQAEIKGLQI
jgi:hypothetical protein